MFAKVKVKRGAVNYFRKLARDNFPFEMLAYLVGRVISVDEVEITDFVYTDKYHTQTTGEVKWYQEDFDKVKAKFELQGKKILGDCHSHPSWDAVMSKTDYNGAITESLFICGICSVYGGKTRIRFWVPTSALPCKIIYI